MSIPVEEQAGFNAAMAHPYVTARRAKHPTYRRRTVYWGEVHRNGRPLYGIGPFRKKAEAIQAAQLWADQQSLPGMVPTVPVLAHVADRVEQKPCDVGLFSDDARQTDLVDMVEKSGWFNADVAKGFAKRIRR